MLARKYNVGDDVLVSSLKYFGHRRLWSFYQ